MNAEILQIVILAAQKTSDRARCLLRAFEKNPNDSKNNIQTICGCEGYYKYTDYCLRHKKQTYFKQDMIKTSKILKSKDAKESHADQSANTAAPPPSSYLQQRLRRVNRRNRAHAFAEHRVTDRDANVGALQHLEKNLVL